MATMLDEEAIERVKREIYEALHEVDDPELGVNLVDLGLIYGIQLTPEGFVTIRMTLTTPGCPMHESLADGVGAALARIPELTGGEIELVWEPRWTPERLTPEGRRLLGLA
ncbi:metal-sulfur cluster assembly factor [Thermogemmatispora onikobensis]|uniref:metal-sulfur cluster assembly factor n=1 Tax=Thermogemmatispora onikobensis TaxID=732234 RepID=UPI001C403E7A|nr:metal-sulfur cluster assembly factor [Thermogemmatispora onikobensis]